MTDLKHKKKYFRVKFLDKDAKEPLEVIVESVLPSDFFGLVVLDKFVFNDQKRFVILPEEDAARKKFGKTERLHIPYHNIIFIEEFFDEPTDVKNLPFIKEVPKE